MSGVRDNSKVRFSHPAQLLSLSCKAIFTSVCGNLMRLNVVLVVSKWGTDRRGLFGVQRASRYDNASEMA